MTLTKFAAECPAGEILTRAVVKQIGGWESFKESAEDVTEHGADGGFSGFIYYTDTLRFYKNHKEEIYSLLHDYAEQFGIQVITLMQGWRCLSNSTEEEIGATLYGSSQKHDTSVANALAWFALEEVARFYVDNK